MIIYEAEKRAGLTDQLSDPAKSSISFASVAEPLNNDDLDQLNISIKNLSNIVKADITDKDLFPLKTILVTTSWNKNDDVFSKEEVWAARHTPEDKPFNLGHNEQDIIGHITDNKCINDEYKLLDDGLTLDLIPDKFHILTSAVIYRAIADKERKDLIEKIIAEIGKGKWYVSMECYFTGFDYAVQGPDKINKIIARSKDSAFLTQHLRAYGGKGEYDGYKVGRLMRNICFSGKGLVEKPANPESIILTDRNSATLSLASQLYDISSLNQTQKIDGEKTMTSENTNELELANAKVKELEAKVSELESANATLTQEKADSIKKFDEVSKELNDTKAEIRLNTRVTALLNAGLTKEDAEAKAKKFDSVDDEMFAEIVNMAEAAKKAKTSEEQGEMTSDNENEEDTMDKSKKGKKSKKAKAEEEAEDEDAEANDEYEETEEEESEAEVDDEDLENAEAAAELDDETEKVVAHVADYFEGCFGKNNKN